MDVIYRHEFMPVINCFMLKSKANYFYSIYKNTVQPSFYPFTFLLICGNTQKLKKKRAKCDVTLHTWIFFSLLGFVQDKGTTTFQKRGSFVLSSGSISSFSISDSLELCNIWNAKDTHKEKIILDLRIQ